MLRTLNAAPTRGDKDKGEIMNADATQPASMKQRRSIRILTIATAWTAGVLAIRQRASK